MLEIESVGLEWSEGDLELSGDVGFEHCSLGVDIKHCHVLAV